MRRKGSSAATPLISRRAAIRGLACGVAALGGAAGAQPTVASHYRFSVGELEIITLSDGHMLQATTMFGTDRADAERDTILRGAGVFGDRVQAAVTVTLAKRGNDITLIDAGSGPNFLETTGKLADSLAAAGIEPKLVTTVIITHGHPDHLWGVVDEFDDSLRFPNARYVMTEAEWALWMTGDPAANLPADRQNFIPGAKRNLARIKDRITLIKPNATIAPGIAAIDTAGHTQGHIAIALSSGSASVIVLADSLIHPVISFAHPDWKIAADHDPDRAVATRKTLLDRLATDRTRVIGYHLPFPGLGHVEKRANAFAFVRA